MLADNGLDSGIKLGRHFIKGPRQAGHLVRTFHPYSHGKIPSGQALDPRFHQLQRLTDPAGNHPGHKGRDHGHHQTAPDHVPIHGGKPLINAGYRNGHAKNAFSVALILKKNGHVHKFLLQGLTVTQGGGSRPGKGGNDLRAVIVIFHAGRIFVRIGKNLAIQGNHRQPGCRFISCLTAVGLQTGLIIARQVREDTAGHEMGPILQHPCRLPQLKRADG